MHLLPIVNKLVSKLIYEIVHVTQDSDDHYFW